MKILIDEGYTTKGKQSGIGHQAYNLYKHLEKISDCSITTYPVLGFIPKVIRKFSYIGWTNIYSLYNKFDIIHFQNFNTPRWRGKNKKIVTINDLGVYHFPETVPFIYVKYNQRMIRKSMERADMVIALAKAGKQELIELFGQKYTDKIETLQCGVREIFWNNKPTANYLNKNGIEPYSYFFFLGTLTRRKNLKFLIEAFLDAKKRKLLKPETKLILGGSKWWGSGDFEELLNSSSDIVTLGYMEDADIANLYYHSKAFVFPSIYEGFGMPIIEAMSQKIPIIISNIATSVELNEQHNNQMIEFKLGDSEDLINAMVNVEQNYQNIKSGLNYGDLSNYKFDSVAERALELYKKVLS